MGLVNWARARRREPRTKSVVTQQPVRRVWTSAHGIQACMAHGMARRGEMYLMRPDQLYGYRSGTQKFELHIVGSATPRMDELTAYMDWADIIIHDPEWDRGHCDDRHCPGDRRNRGR